IWCEDVAARRNETTSAGGSGFNAGGSVLDSSNLPSALMRINRSLSTIAQSEPCTSETALERTDDVRFGKSRSQIIWEPSESVGWAARSLAPANRTVSSPSEREVRALMRAIS